MKLEADFHLQTYLRWPVVFVRGRGNRLWDGDGNEYLDFVAGLGVVNTGHCHPKVVEAIREQSGRLLHTSNLYYTEPQAKLAEKLAGLTFGDRVFFCNSGAEANEAAIKLTRRHASLKRGPGEHTIITALGSFHGRTMKTLAATGQPDKQAPFRPLPPGFKHVPLNDPAALEAALGADTCAVMLEPIQGEGGVYPCDPGYLKRVRGLCDERGLLLILDEIQTGMGRTGAMFAYERYGVRPDIMTVAKGLASGLPIGATIATQEVAASFKPGDHGSTFGGGPVPCAAALATLEVFEEEGLLANCAEVGAYFMQELAKLSKNNTLVGEPRGAGLMLAFDLSQPLARRVAEAMLKRRILTNNIGDKILRFLPPLVSTREDVDLVMAALNDALAEVGSGGSR